jgi:hypothetical protein
VQRRQQPRPALRIGWSRARSALAAGLPRAPAAAATTLAATAPAAAAIATAAGRTGSAAPRTRAARAVDTAALPTGPAGSAAACAEAPALRVGPATAVMAAAACAMGRPLARAGRAARPGRLPGGACGARPARDTRDAGRAAAARPAATAGVLGQVALELRAADPHQGRDALRDLLAQREGRQRQQQRTRLGLQPGPALGRGEVDLLGQAAHQEFGQRQRAGQRLAPAGLAVLAHEAVGVVLGRQEQEVHPLGVLHLRQAGFQRRQAALRPAASPSNANTTRSTRRSSLPTCCGVVAVPSVATALPTPCCESITTSM